MYVSGSSFQHLEMLVWAADNDVCIMDMSECASQCFENKFNRIVLAAANTSTRDLGNSSYVDEVSCNPMTMVDFFMF